MAHVIEFYVPMNFRKKVRPAPKAHPGRVIEFYQRRRNRRNAPSTRGRLGSDAGQPSEAMERLAVSGNFPGWRLLQLLQQCFH